MLEATDLANVHTHHSPLMLPTYLPDFVLAGPDKAGSSFAKVSQSEDNTIATGASVMMGRIGMDLVVTTKKAWTQSKGHFGGNAPIKAQPLARDNPPLLTGYGNLLEWAMEAAEGL